VVFAKEREGTPLLTMGHSMGAMTALFTAALEPEIRGVISIATGYGRPTAIAALQRAGVTDFRAGYVDGLALPELVQDVDERYDKLLPRLAGRPALYVAASRDAMVSPGSVVELYNRAPDPKELVTIESDHTNAGENARGVVLQWLNAMHPRS
jgi:fermentation-respiration switch protein FrsA (DUF1100 family)